MILFDLDACRAFTFVTCNDIVVNMLAEHRSRARAGRPSAVQIDAIIAAATQIADDAGLDEVTLRAVGSAVGVSAMAVHRATGGIDALRHRLIAAVVDEAISQVHWPQNDWRATIEVFAYGLRDLLMRHPLALEAHRKASLDTPRADDVAHRVVAALASAGLSPEQAAYGYAAVHDFVTGHVAIRLGRGDHEALTGDSERLAASVFVNFHDPDARFEFGLRLLLDGLFASARRNTDVAQ